MASGYRSRILAGSPRVSEPKIRKRRGGEGMDQNGCEPDFENMATSLRSGASLEARASKSSQIVSFTCFQ